ncbi:uncharacterized protein EV422DRAFT_137250 [Fimicolochytrium jonesii]|uniref:uncharacterized protein n=1 Tax=Fimicolochytrium jonesii TaxID=1396493 RepID=UPI0022FE004C|nr:uncharacterized protein EV422DRAFT_137250 [Fimicolochytrium jonesii]KAI8825702.1 hypothetical protein EV422DRAFT_137250 [Fimicolochytrium jonesii]
MAEEADEPSPRRVGNLAKMFESQMPAPSETPGNRTSRIFSQPNSRRPSGQELAPPSFQNGRSTSSPWSSRNSSTTTLASNGYARTLHSAGNSTEVLNRNSSRSGSQGNVGISNAHGEDSGAGTNGARPRNTTQTGEMSPETKRLSVSRLSMMFEGGLDVHSLGFGQQAGNVPDVRSGQPRGGIDRSGGRRVPSTGVPSRVDSTYKSMRDFSGSSSPAGSSESLSKNRHDVPVQRSRESSIEVPHTVPVKERIKSWAVDLPAGAATPWLSAPFIHVESPSSERDTPKAPAIPSPGASYPVPMPPKSTPSSPAFKRSRPPAPPPPSHSSRAIESLQSSISPVLVMPMPRSSTAPQISDLAQTTLGSIATDEPTRPPLVPTLSEPIVEPIKSVVTGEEEKKQKRHNIIKELVTTERGFLKDMEVLMEVYALPASEQKILSERDLRNLFSNLDVIISTSRALLEMLEAAVGSPDEWIGEAFNQMMRKIESTYCDYCKHNEAALAKLAEFASPECPPDVKEFLKNSQMQLQGRTGAWDLGSLVIKPVQRVLKYPLLIKQLLKETPPTHPDFEQLVQAAADIDVVAEKINEVKKRKDIVERYVDKKGNANVIHGITKKWTRGTHQIKKATGLADGSAAIQSDALYDALIEKLDQQLRGVQQLSVDLQTWLSKLQLFSEIQETLVTAFEDIYVMGRDRSRQDVPAAGRDDFFAIQEFQKAAVRFSVTAWRDADTTTREVIQPALDVLAKMFRGPQVVIKKREQKQLDYERAMAIKARGEQVDKVLTDSADAYSSIHAQLIEELPRFLDLAAKYIDVVAVHIADMQARTHKTFLEQVQPIVQLITADQSGEVASHASVVEEYKAALAVGGDLELFTRSITLLARWRETVWENAPILEAPYSGFGGGLGVGTGMSSRSSSRSELSTLTPDFGPRSSSTFPRPSNGTSASSSSSFKGLPHQARRADTDSKLIDYDAGLQSPMPSYQPAFLNTQFTPLIPTHYTSNNPDTHSTSTSPPPNSSHSRTASATNNTTNKTTRTPSPPLGFEAVAIYDFEADLPEEVELKAGDRIRVLEAEGSGGEWWFGLVNGKEGWFPGTYVERV